MCEMDVISRKFGRNSIDKICGESLVGGEGMV